MDFKYLFFAFLALALTVEALAATTKAEEQMEDSTESPIADLAIIDTDELKTSTERPPIAAMTSQKTSTAAKSELPQNAEPHTVADFIIHPLIAFKPRSPEEDLAGKQAGDSSSSTTPSPWSIFGFNTGQGLGSSVSSIAGSVSGWFNDRIQLPGLVDSPVRDSTTTSTTSTTSTTQRPDVVVRVQHRSTRRPLIGINNRNRPYNFQNNNNLNYDSYEDDDDYEYEYINNNKRRKNNNRRKPNRDEDEEDDDEDYSPVRRPQRKQTNRRRRPVQDDFSEEDDDNDWQSAENNYEGDNNESNENYDEEGDTPQRPNRRRNQVQNQNNRRRQQQNRRPLKSIQEDQADEHFYYGSQSGRPSTKRSQNEANFFQRGQESILNQIRQLTGNRTPAEVGTLVRKSTLQTESTPKRRQQTTLLVNRNGQTVYLAPELLNTADLPLVNSQVQYVTEGATKFPQPPLSVPLKRKSAPTQYITIPWSQLGISPPDQLQSVTEGIQTQPLILNIPASALQTIQNQSYKVKKQPVITAEAVPLLAETSLMDVFKPPKIPNDRQSTNTVFIASKKKPSSSSTTVTSVILPQRIRPGTIVEKAPATADSQQTDSEEMTEKDAMSNVENEYIFVGEDNEHGLTRQVKPVHGEGRFAYGANGKPHLGWLKRGRFDAHRTGRELEVPAGGEQSAKQEPEQLKPDGELEVPAGGEQSAKQEPEQLKQDSVQLIPVKIISEPAEAAAPQPLVQTLQQTESSQIAPSEPHVDVQEKALEGAAGVLVNVPIEENKNESEVVGAT